ncbi:hypothetical protein [Paracidovorax oryzae]|uniref:hypothetical protein n=1 Tax=Paracidovorax oryzae TaxID=862720 RepID=UPI0012EBCF0B|nr:hypothetical protein [Paracidovorax oryzae]
MQKNKISELLDACSILNVPAKIISAENFESKKNEIFKKYHPEQTVNHYSIGGDSIVLPTEEYEFSLFENFPDINILLFFGSDSKEDCLSIESLSSLSKIMENCYGMEYFVSDQDASFLISVNWYVINLQGAAKQWVPSGF